MDEILIQKFLEKQKMKEKDLYDLEKDLECDSEEINSESKEKEAQKNE